jgi:hypothetical protein
LLLQTYSWITCWCSFNVITNGNVGDVTDRPLDRSQKPFVKIEEQKLPPIGSKDRKIAGYISQNFRETLLHRNYETNSPPENLRDIGSEGSKDRYIGYNIILEHR